MTALWSFPGEPVLVPNHPLCEEAFSNIQPKPSLTQLHALPSGPICGHQREEISTCPSIPPHYEAVGCVEICPQNSTIQCEVEWWNFAEQNRTIPSLDWLVIFCLIQPRTQLALLAPRTLLTHIQLSARTPRTLSQYCSTVSCSLVCRYI